jgi:hypothetical protein
MNKTGGITLDATGAETYGTVVALAESYVRPGFLYAGTDDGNVWTTRNDGSTWEQIPTTKFPGLPAGDVYVSRIEPSHFDTTTFYITFDNHRWNDFTPYAYVTNDAGKTFRSIAGGLPHESPADFVHVIREDPYNRDLLYVGTSRAAYVSLNRGQSWQRFSSGMPTVPVYDLKIHPRDRELIAATHGRGFWIVDVAPLEQMAGDSGRKVVADNTYLFTPKTAYEYGQGPAVGASSNGEGQKFFNAPSPQYGAEIVYRIAPGAAPAAAAQAGNASDANGNATPNGGRGGRAPREQAKIVITDAKGDTVQTLNGPATAGLHRVTWDFRGKPPVRVLSISEKRDSIVRMNRINFVFDSLEKANVMPKATLDRMRQMITSGNPGFGRGGGGGRGGAGGGGWVARPGEGAFIGGRGGRGGAGQGEGAQAGGGENIQDMLEQFPGGAEELGELLRPPGQRGARGGGGFGAIFGFGGGRGNQAPVVNSGDYLVTLNVGGRTYKQVLRVERASGGDDVSTGFLDEEHDPRK